VGGLRVRDHALEVSDAHRPAAGGGHADDALFEPDLGPDTTRRIAAAGQGYEPIPVRFVDQQHRMSVAEEMIDAVQRDVDHLVERGDRCQPVAERDEQSQVSRFLGHGAGATSGWPYGTSVTSSTRNTSIERRRGTPVMPVSAAIASIEVRAPSNRSPSVSDRSRRATNR
jgi:hypothetical protein